MSLKVLFLWSCITISGLVAAISLSVCICISQSIVVFFLAREWAAHRFGENNSAVLVFQVRKVELRGDSNDNGLDLTDIDRKKREWQELVKVFLSKTSSKRFLNTVRGYDFIEGPMVAKGRKDFLSFPKPKNDSYQLCVRGDNCVSLFDRSLCAVVYFA